MWPFLIGKVALETSTMAQSTWNLILMILSSEELDFAKIEFQNRNILLNSLKKVTICYIFFKIVVCLDYMIWPFGFKFE